MSDTARISLDPPNTALMRLMRWWSRRTYGHVLEPGLAMGHNRKVLVSMVRTERGVERWDALDETLKDLATLASAVAIGCSWCVDFGYWISHTKGVHQDKLDAVASGLLDRRSALTEIERRVVEYAEAMSATPPQVTDEMVAGLRAHLDDAALVELTAIVALENERSRFNTALGLTSQGFKDQCELRPAATTREAAAR